MVTTAAEENVGLVAVTVNSPDPRNRVLTPLTSLPPSERQWQAGCGQSSFAVERLLRSRADREEDHRALSELHELIHPAWAGTRLAVYFRHA